MILKSKSYKPYIIFFYSLCCALMVFAAFFDLKIDIALNNPENPFAIWFRNTGEMPSRLIAPLAGAVLVKTCEKPIEKLLGYVICLGGSAYLGFHMSSYFLFENENHTSGEEINIAYGIVYGIGVGIIIIMTIKLIHIPKRMVTPLRTIAIMGILIMLIQLATVEVSKYLWGRVRFRDLLKAQNYEAFTPWYHPNGINGNKSFPSGHTAGAGMSFLMMYLPYISKKWENKTAICFFLPLVYTFTVGFTRLVMGAHYLSDITAGAIISFTIVIAGIKIYENRYMNKKQS